MTILINPDQVFFDNRIGRPVANGTAYFGEPNQDPETNPKQPFSDVLLTTTIETTQLLTSAGKLPQRTYLGGDYSLRVRDYSGTIVFTEMIVSGSEQTFSTVQAATVADYDAMVTLLQNNDFPIGSLIRTVSPNGYFYEKKQGVATDDGRRIIAENRGTTTAIQYYAEVTGAASEMATYGSNGDHYIDIGTPDANVLILQPGKMPLKTLEDGMIFRFSPSSTNTGAATADISSIFGQSAGVIVKGIKQIGDIELSPQQIRVDTPVELVYFELFDHLLLKNSAALSSYDNFTSLLNASDSQSAIDEINTKVDRIGSSAANIAGPSTTLTVGGTYHISAYGISAARGNDSATLIGFKLLDEFDQELYSEPNTVINWPDGNFPISRTVIHTATGSGFIKAQVDGQDAKNLTVVRLS